MSLTHGKTPSPCRTLSPNPVSPMKTCSITSSTATSASHIDLLNFRRGTKRDSAAYEVLSMLCPWCHVPLLSLLFLVIGVPVDNYTHKSAFMYTHTYSRRQALERCANLGAWIQFLACGQYMFQR